MLGKQAIGQCQHLRQPVGEVECPSCQGRVRVKVFGCEIHQKCTIAKMIEDTVCCAICPDYQEEPIP